MFLIAGPCVIEDSFLTESIAGELKAITDELGVEFYFKASYDKANRTRIDSYRGPGFNEGLCILSDIRYKLGVKVLSDVHEAADCDTAAIVLDVLQIPAFLCRQTDLIVAAAKTGKQLNIKKGQFLKTGDIFDVARKVGHDNFWITERGSCFGHGDLVVDFRNFYPSAGVRWVYDASHSSTDSKFIPMLCRAAVAAGIDGVFIEVHPDPSKAKCDGKTSLRLGDVKRLLTELLEIEGTIIRNRRYI